MVLSTGGLGEIVVAGAIPLFGVFGLI